MVLIRTDLRGDSKEYPNNMFFGGIWKITHKLSRNTLHHQMLSFHLIVIYSEIMTTSAQKMIQLLMKMNGMIVRVIMENSQISREQHDKIGRK